MKKIPVVLTAVLGLYVLPAMAAPCETLASTALPNATISVAETVAAGQFTPPAATAGRGGFQTLPAFCRVVAKLKPSSDSDINIEVWLPATGWNGNFQPAGNGNWGGSINFAEMANILRSGFATASTDTGHAGSVASFAYGHPEKLVDFGYRAFHEMTVAAKALVSAYYGSGPKLSLINQCGGGSREALASIQRFPADYDAAGVIGFDGHKTTLHFGQIWLYQATHKEPASYIPPEKYPMIHQAILNRCDGLADGVKDGIVDNPEACPWNPEEIQCKEGDGSNCLTAAQVEAVRTIYTPVTNPKTKARVNSQVFKGSELGWGSAAGPDPFPNAVEFFKWVVFADPNWDYKTRPVNFDTDVAIAQGPALSALSAVNPDITGFLDRGGKILIVGGWADAAIAPGASIDYYKAVVAKMGADKVRDSVRLFMVPGMGHCLGTTGTDAFNFDSLKLLQDWREGGKAPEQIVATHYQNGKEAGTRLVCAYPQIAVYTGAGRPNDAANFVCKLPR
jgi:feruloyl esterase